MDDPKTFADQRMYEQARGNDPVNWLATMYRVYRLAFDFASCPSSFRLKPQAGAGCAQARSIYVPTRCDLGGFNLGSFASYENSQISDEWGAN